MCRKHTCIARLCSFWLFLSQTWRYFQRPIVGKVLYCQKMLMWSDQLSYVGEFVKKASTNKFVCALFYIPAWLKCNIGVDAPINDLNFLYDTLMHKNEGPTIADSTFNKLSLHHGIWCKKRWHSPFLASILCWQMKWKSPRHSSSFQYHHQMNSQRNSRF